MNGRLAAVSVAAAGCFSLSLSLISLSLFALSLAASLVAAERPLSNLSLSHLSLNSLWFCLLLVLGGGRRGKKRMGAKNGEKQAIKNGFLSTDWDKTGPRPLPPTPFSLKSKETKNNASNKEKERVEAGAPKRRKWRQGEGKTEKSQLSELPQQHVPSRVPGDQRVPRTGSQRPHRRARVAVQRARGGRREEVKRRV
jgi:hypothetical protein